MSRYISIACVLLAAIVSISVLAQTVVNGYRVYVDLGKDPSTPASGRTAIYTKGGEIKSITNGGSAKTVQYTDTAMAQAVENSVDNSVPAGVGTSGRAFEKTPLTVDPSTGDASTTGTLELGRGTTDPWYTTGYTDDVAPAAPGTANQFTLFFDRTAGLPSWILNGGTQKYVANGDSTGGVTNFGGGVEPTCNVSNRGRVVMVYGGAGVADTLRVCSKDGADSYGWRVLY